MALQIKAEHFLNILFIFENDLLKEVKYMNEKFQCMRVSKYDYKSRENKDFLLRKSKRLLFNATYNMK